MRAAPSSAQRAWALALLLSLTVWNLPFGGVVLYPFKLLATWLHELSHGLAMQLSGAGLDRLVVYPDSSGMAYAREAAPALSRPFIAAAGYMGTPLWGGLLLLVARTPGRARAALLGLAAALALTALWLLDNAFGQRAMAAIALGALAAALLLPPSWRVPAVQFVAAQAGIHALLDIRVLFRPVQLVGGRVAAMSDAHAMAAATFGTTASWAVWTWAALWLAWSLAVSFAAVRLAARHRAGPAAPAR